MGYRYFKASLHMGQELGCHMIVSNYLSFIVLFECSTNNIIRQKTVFLLKLKVIKIYLYLIKCIDLIYETNF